MKDKSVATRHRLIKEGTNDLVRRSERKEQKEEQEEKKGEEESDRESLRRRRSSSAVHACKEEDRQQISASPALCQPLRGLQSSSVAIFPTVHSCCASRWVGSVLCECSSSCFCVGLPSNLGFCFEDW